MNSFLTVTTAAATTDLTTLATLKAELGITDNSKDANLQAAITWASGVIAEHCNRVLGLETVVQTFRLDRDVPVLVLDRFPVTEITSITDSAGDVAEEDWEIDGSAGMLRKLSSDDVVDWPAGKIVVTYVAGYDLIGSLPYGLERACLALAKGFYFARSRDPLLRSEDVPGVESVSYWVSAGGDAADLPPDVAGLLSKYKRVLL